MRGLRDELAALRETLDDLSKNPGRNDDGFDIGARAARRDVIEDLDRLLDRFPPEAEGEAATALYAARDALYRGEGPDAYADSDIQYGEWLSNRADRLAASPEEQDR